MSKENILIFDKVKCNMVFEIQFFSFGNDEILDEYVEISCGEDIENLFEAFKNKKWDELFYKQSYSNNDIAHVEFKGIQFFAENIDGHRFRVGNENGMRQYANAVLNIEKLGENNSLKLKQIRNILDN